MNQFTAENSGEIVNRLLKSCNESAQRTNECRGMIEQSFDFFMDEIEIRIESAKMDLDNVNKLLNRKTRRLKRGLLELNRNIPLDDESLFSDVSLYTLDMKARVLDALSKKLNGLMSEPLFRATKNDIDVKNVGLVPDRVFENKLFPEEERAALEEGLRRLDLRSINEMKSFFRPPRMVQVVAEAVCILLRIEASWSSFKRAASRRDFLQSLLMLDLANMPDDVYRRLSIYINLPEFQADVCRNVSLACGNLCSWVIAVHMVLRARRENPV